MKNLFLLCILSIGLGQLHAQITLEESDYRLEVGTPFYTSPVYDSTATIPTEGIDQVWDYTSLFVAGADTTTLEAYTGAEFPTANASLDLVSLQRVGPLTVPFDRTNYYILDENVYGRVGVKFQPLDIPTAALTGNAGDSINYLESNGVYPGNPGYDAWFPMNYEDSLNSTYTVNNEFLLTVTAFGLDHVPCLNKVEGTNSDEVIGWGKLSLVNPADQNTVELDVLLVKDVIVEADSFFIGGVPFPQALLDAFGVGQGIERGSVNYKFFAKGFSTPVLMLHQVEGRIEGNIASDLNPVILNQITLDRSDFIAEAGLSIFSLEIDPESVSTPTEGSNRVWDYTGLPTIGADTTTLAASSSDRYPLANLQILSQSVVSAGNVSAPFDRTRYMVLNDTTYAQVGVEFGPVGIPLLTITGGATDSLNGLESFGVFANPNETAWFPMNHGDETRGSNYVIDVQFLLTVAAFGLDQVPTLNRVSGSATQEVVGWGALSLTNPMDQAEITHDVLLMKTTTVEVDSFFLGGAPMPLALLMAFGVTQGSADTFTTYRFYAEDYPDAVLTINDGSAQILAGWDFLTTSTNAQEDSYIPFAYYPNPAADQINIEFEKSTSEPWMYSLYNSLGQQVFTHAVTQPKGAVNEVISFNKKFSAGNYFYVLHSGNRQVMSSGSLMIK